jgi:diguanylate cyclase (GGDEF)-like protein
MGQSQLVQSQLVRLVVVMTSAVTRGADRPRQSARAIAPRVWLLTAVLSGLAAAGYVMYAHAGGGSQNGGVAGWLALAAGFAMTEACVLHLTIGRQAHSFAFAEIPLVVGLLYLPAHELLSARLVGTTVALLVFRRLPLMKVAFNLAQYALGVVVALSVWRMVANADLGSPVTSIAVLSAMLAAAFVSALAVNAVMWLVEERRAASVFGRTLSTGLLTAGVNTAFALVAVTVFRDDWRGAWAVVVIAAFLGLAQRAHIRLQKRHNALQKLDDVAGRLGRDLHVQTVAEEIVVGTSRTLDGAVVELELTNPVTGPSLLRFDGQQLHTTSAGPSPGVRRTRHFRIGLQRGIEVVRAPLRTHAGVVGYLTVSSASPVAGFGPDEESLVNAIAHHASIALANSRLADELRVQVADNEHQATHDPLTGLANRLMFERVVDAMLGSDRALGVLLFDLDRFKQVNDTLGHAAGDALLRDVGERLRVAVPQALCIARLGGDEFTILLTNADVASASAAAECAREALLNPVELNCVPVSVDASIGIALAPQHGRSCDELLRRADVAMYAAKDGRHGVVVYDPQYDDNDASRLGMVAELRDAVQKDQLFLHYQPKVSLVDGNAHGRASVEALVRWNHPVRGLVAPDDFIGIAEQTGVIVALTDWVLTRSLTECRRWLDSGLDMSIAVNISPRVLRDATFPDRLAEMLATHRVPAARLTLEITESAIMDDVEHTVDVLWQLRKAGVRLSIDDLGIGQSSLAYLKRLPVHEVKIDKSFVLNMADDQDDDAIVCMVVGLAHRLRLSVVAEGVETVHARERLVEIGCDVAQGYWYSRPLASADVAPWFAGRADLGRPTAGKPQLRVAQS